MKSPGTAEGAWPIESDRGVQLVESIGQLLDTEKGRRGYCDQAQPQYAEACVGMSRVSTVPPRQACGFPLFSALRPGSSAG